MKKLSVIISAAITLTLILSLAACKNSPAGTSNGKSPKTLMYGDVDLSKYVILGDYKGLTADTSSSEYKDAYEKIVSNDLSGSSIFDQKTEGTVAEGDTVNIDYEGKRDGVAFDGGTAQGYDLTIGSHSFIDGFEDGLIGVTIGDTVDLNLTFPENYGNSDLAGAAVVFTVKVNYVKSTDTVNISEHYEELGFKSEEEYKSDAKERAIKNLLLDKVIENSKVKDYPQTAKNVFIDAVYEYYDNYYNSAYNVGFEEVLKSNNMTVEDFKNEMSESAEEGMKEQMICYAILKNEGLKADYELKDNEKADQKVLDEVTKVEKTVINFIYDNAKIK